MKITLINNNIVLSENPKVNVPGALLIITDKIEPVYTDVIADKQIYPLPKGILEKNVASIYLRIL